MINFRLILSRYGMLPSEGRTFRSQALFEIRKVQRKIRSRLFFAFRKPITKRWDKKRPFHIEAFNAEVAIRSKRTAVFLIYQPNGVCSTVFSTARHLLQSAFHTVVVSNGPIKAADIHLLTSLGCTVLVRPNIGYDFGGYRDAVWWLSEYAPKTQDVLFLNDSIWFPALKNCNVLDRIQKKTGDCISLFGSVDKNGQVVSMDSFFFYIKASQWKKPAFHSMWRDMTLQPDKRHVVRNCERQLVGLLASSGASVSVLHSHPEVLARVRTLDQSKWISVYSRLFFIGRNKREAFEAKVESFERSLISEDELWAHALGLISSSHVLEILGYTQLRDSQVCVLKKKLLLNSPSNLQRFLLFSEQDGLNLHETVRAELEAIHAKELVESDSRPNLFS